MTRRSLTMLFVLSAAAAAGTAIHGCSEGRTTYVSDAGVTQLTSDNAVALKPGGPDAIGGAGAEVGTDLGDFVLMNKHLRAVVDQPGIDPSSLGGAFPLTNVLAPTGGTLVDLASRSIDNDQWLQSGQGVVGIVTRVPDGTAGTADEGAQDTFIDATRDFTALGVLPGDTLVILNGLNAGRSYRIGLIADLPSPPFGADNNSVLGLFVPPGVVYEDDGGAVPGGTLDYLVVHRTSPLSNLIAYDDAQIVNGRADPAVLRVSGGILNANLGELPDGTGVDPATGRLTVGGSPITVETDYLLFRDARYLTVETRIENPGGGAVGLVSVADVVITGGLGEPNIAPWTPLTGFAAQGLASPVIVPFVSFQGRDEPQVSYTLVDAQVGQMIVVTDGGIVTAAIQLSTATSLAGGGTLTWLRHVAVGERDDVASSADEAIALLALSPVRVNPATGGTVPNGFQGLTRLTGYVRGAPAGTTITAIQVTPALVFDAGAPNGLSAATGFYTSALYGAPELLLTQTRPDDHGNFRLDVPSRFAGLAPAATATPDLAAPAGLENGADASYRLLLEAPGHDPQTVVVNVVGGVQTGGVVFDLLGETGTIELEVTDENGDPLPAKVIVVGRDPDGAGPTAATPDPNFGVAGTNVDLPRATGKDNVVHLLDGRGSVRVAPGAYQVIATCGLEYSVARFPEPTSSVDFFLIGAGQTVRAETTAGAPLQLTRVLDSDALPDPGGGGTFTSPLRQYVSADFHVHAGGSFDSPIPLRDRVISYLASNLEVMVSTEHDKLVDFAPVIDRLDRETTLDLERMITSQVGVESTGFVGVNVPGVLEFPNTIGHFNGWPVRFQPQLRRNGAPADEYRSPAQLYEQLRTLDAVIVQMNHARFPILEAPLPPIGLGFLTNGKAGFAQPNTGTAALAAGGYNLPLRTVTSGGDGGIDDLNLVRTAGGTRYNSFDTFEVYGGNLTLYDLQRLDWYALMSAGYVRTGTANSDSHGLDGEPAFPRTFVRTPGDGSADVGAVDPAALNATVLPSLVQTTSGTTKPLAAELFPAIERPTGGPDGMDVVGTSGPVVLIEVDGDQDGTFEGGVGDLVVDNAGNVDVRVTVLAPAWVPVDQVRILVNGGNAAAEVLGVPAAGPLTGIGGGVFDVPALDIVAPTGGDFSTALTDVVRLREVYTVALPAGAGQDHWIIAEVRGAAAAGSTYDLLLSALDTAVGFTNPVFIDTNADGDWDPPGVP